MTRSLVAITLMLILLPLTSAIAQTQDVLYFADFEDGTTDFVSGDPAAELSVTDDPDLVFSGERSLQLEYVQAPIYPDVPDWGFPGAVFLPVPEGAAGVGEIAFALRTELSTPIIVVLAEGEDGPRYNCLLWCSAERWNEYSLALDDFSLDLDGPADPNGTLDPELISGLAIADGDALVRLLAESSPLFHMEPAAEQTMWLDEFAARAGQRISAPAPEGRQALADYSPPMRGFLTIGGRDVTVSSEDQPDGDRALRIDYTTPAGTLFGILHAVRPGALADDATVRFHARSNREVTLLVVLEERREPGELGVSRYQSIVPLTASDEFEMITLPLSLFELQDDQTDPDGALNAELVNLLSIVDITAIIENSEVINALRLKAPVVVE
jgi:hypothetical protein